MTKTVAVIVTCEHGGNRVPRRYRGLFRGAKRALSGHRGYDPGALDMARHLATKLDAPLEFSRVSRLVADLNRSVGHRFVFSEFSRAAPRHAREDIVRRFYEPHRTRVERRIARLIGRGHVVVHVASHTFTPVLHGDVRTADVAWLYDPRRPREKHFCRRWRDALRVLRPDLRLRRNYPYRGTDDGFTTSLRRKFAASCYLGIELEVNQKWFFGARAEWTALKRSVAEAFGAASQPAPRARSDPSRGVVAIQTHRGSKR